MIEFKPNVVLLNKEGEVKGEYLAEGSGNYRIYTSEDTWLNGGRVITRHEFIEYELKELNINTWKACVYRRKCRKRMFGYIALFTAIWAVIVYFWL